MALKYLIDTNIFLEILLNQEKKDDCKSFLERNTGNLFVTDFSLHSIGVILSRKKQTKLLQLFINDVLPEIKILSLDFIDFNKIIESIENYTLDFDDSYQLVISEIHNLTITTLDHDFEKVSKKIKINFIG